jgi:ParB family chromosome partitioning protein
MMDMDKKELMAGLYGGGNTNPASAALSITMIPLNQINNYHNHTFVVRQDEEMDGLILSFGNNPDIVEPIHVRKSEKYGAPYECIAGHRRRVAAREAGREDIAAIVLDIDDAAADLWMVDSNVNTRSELSLRELCESLKVKYLAMKKQGKGGGRADAQLGCEYKMSGTTIQRLITLTKLNDDLLALVENNTFTKGVGETLSKLSKDAQQHVASAVIDSKGKARKISAEEATQIVASSLEKGAEFTFNDVLDIITRETTKPKEKYSFSEKEVKELFPDDYFTSETTPAEVKSLIRDIIQQYFNN